MADSLLPPIFGANVDPHYENPQEPLQRARLIEDAGYELLTIQDHPYNSKYYDALTLLAAIATQTERVRLAANVHNLPLRPPSMLAKQLTTLDQLSGGRMEIGLGAGAVWEGIRAMGGPQRTGREAYQAFKDALHIIRGFLDNAGRGSFSYEGQFYSVKGMKAGPPPAHDMQIWVGATGPSMMRLAGRMADGIIVSRNWVAPERLAALHEAIDEGAEEAGRSPQHIRRMYNVMGVLDVGLPETAIRSERQPGFIYGTCQEWTDALLDLYNNYRMDTFIFWPAGEGKFAQLQGFASEVMPSLIEAITGRHAVSRDSRLDERIEQTFPASDPIPPPGAG